MRVTVQTPQFRLVPTLIRKQSQFRTIVRITVIPPSNRYGIQPQNGSARILASLLGSSLTIAHERVRGVCGTFTTADIFLS